MEFSLRWLAEHVELPEGPDGPQQLARRLTAAGFAVEGLKAHTGQDGVDDTILDVDVTTNRPDAMNHLGLAREIAVLFDLPLRRPACEAPEGTEPVEGAARVEIEDFAGCPRFAARVVRGAKVGPSPAWLRARLEAIGLRSISNVVDVTNFVLWEMGQPLHAYDLAKLAGAKLVARRARPGETLTTLDGVERKLDPEMLVIADAEQAVGLGGIMGGLDSEVTEGTSDILIEGAHFDRQVVRRTARRLGMHTDASHRFERGADPGACADAVSRAARLIAEIAGGTVLAGGIDVRDAGRNWHRQGPLDLAKLNAFAGIDIPRAAAERWLRGLGFALEPVPEGGAPAGDWKVTVPSWRHYDFEPRPSGEIYPADLYEEVIRIHGFDDIPAALPAVPGADAPKAEFQIRRERVRRLLAASGYTESIHFAFLEPAAEAALPNLAPATAEGEAVRLANPLSEQYSVLRRTLLPSLVETARFNQRRGAASVRLFEVATVFFGQGKALPEQPEHLALVCGGRVGSPWQREVDLDLFDLKGVLENLFEAFGVRIEVRAAHLPGLLAGSSAELLREGRRAGTLGRVEAEEGYPLYVAELALSALEKGEVTLEVEIPSRFPGIAVDFTFTHPLSVTWEEIERAVAELATGDLVSHSLKVRYRGQGVPDGAVNTTISFLYQARERSLTQEEVNEHHFALGRELERRFGWKG